TARSVAAWLGRVSFAAIAAAIGPDVEFVDHRPVGLPSSRGRDAYMRSLGSLFELVDDMSNRLDAVLALRADGFVFRVTNLGTERAGGGRFERLILLLCVYDAEGLVSHLEFFAVDREDEALARFDALVRESELTNEPMDAGGRSAATPFGPRGPLPATV